MSIPPEASLADALRTSLVAEFDRQLRDAYEKGAADERDRILRIARNVRACCPADHPIGAMASFANYIETLDGEA